MKINTTYKKILKAVANKKSEYRTFRTKLKAEFDNYGEAKEILVRYIQKKEVSKKEMVFFRKQLIEMSKSLGYVIPAAIIPFGIPLMSFVVYLLNKYDIDIVPSYMKKDKDENEPTKS